MRRRSLFDENGYGRHQSIGHPVLQIRDTPIDAFRDAHAHVSMVMFTWLFGVIRDSVDAPDRFFKYFHVDVVLCLTGQGKVCPPTPLMLEA